MSEALLPVRVGDIVGEKYRVEKLLGAGGMGFVVAALHLELSRRVALKFLLPKVIDRPELVTRFAREARAAAQLESEHVARVLDVGATASGAPFIVMEYLEGQDLAKVLSAEGPLPFRRAVGYLLEAGEAIAEAHALGIIHRDLKPANLFLANRATGSPTVKVLDFGISKFDPSGDGRLTSESSILGSPLYIAPEQLLTAHTADARSDIWSLGVVLYELLTGRAPFQKSGAELFAEILQSAPEPFEKWGVEIPGGLRDLVGRCLQKDPAHRFANMAVLAEALWPFAPPHGRRSVDRIAHILQSAPPAGGAAQRGLEQGKMTAATRPVRPGHDSVAASSQSLAAPLVNRPRRKELGGRVRIVGGLLLLSATAVISVAIARLTVSFKGPSTTDVPRVIVGPPSTVPQATKSTGAQPQAPSPDPADSTSVLVSERLPHEDALDAGRSAPVPQQQGGKREIQPGQNGLLPRPAQTARPVASSPTVTQPVAPPSDSSGVDPLGRLKPM